MSGAEKVVCVTGASGYIASWLVKLLLQRGYTVKATVRDPNDPKKTKHLLELDGAKERLQLFKAELMEEGCFDTVVDGCQGVFHTASPVFFAASDPQSELIDPAVKGTLNVLRSCAKVSSVKRVILTSSMASVLCNEKPLTPDVVVDETWFSDPVTCEESKNWYAVSKTLAENAAWKFAKDNGIDLVAIHPGFVIGPLLQPTLPFCMEGILKLINGISIFPDGIYRFVDIKDVANAHIQGFENPAASGRYCVVGNITLYSEALKILQKLYPTLNIPKKCEDDKPFSPAYQVSKDKVKSLGGKKTFPNSFNRFVNVRDVGNAHILAFEVPSASGRYCVVGAVAHFSVALKILHELYPTLQLPEKCEDEKPFLPTYQVSKEKAKGLGINFTPLQFTLKDTIESFKEKGFLSV